MGPVRRRDTARRELKKLSYSADGHTRGVQLGGSGPLGYYARARRSGTPAADCATSALPAAGGCIRKKGAAAPVASAISECSRAYDELASTLHAGVANLYGHLAQAFAHLVRVLMELRRRMRDVAPLILHELCTSGRGADRDPQFPGAVLLSGNATQQ